MINLRGKVIPVIALRKRFGVEQQHQLIAVTHRLSIGPRIPAHHLIFVGEVPSLFSHAEAMRAGSLLHRTRYISPRIGGFSYVGITYKILETGAASL